MGQLGAHSIFEDFYLVLLLFCLSLLFIRWFTIGSWYAFILSLYRARSLLCCHLIVVLYHRNARHLQLRQTHSRFDLFFITASRWCRIRFLFILKFMARTLAIGLILTPCIQDALQVILLAGVHIFIVGWSFTISSRYGWVLAATWISINGASCIIASYCTCLVRIVCLCCNICVLYFLMSITDSYDLRRIL